MLNVSCSEVAQRLYGSCIVLIRVEIRTAKHWYYSISASGQQKFVFFHCKIRILFQFQRTLSHFLHVLILITSFDHDIIKNEKSKWYQRFLRRRQSPHSEGRCLSIEQGCATDQKVGGSNPSQRAIIDKQFWYKIAYLFFLLFYLKTARNIRI